MIHPYLQFVCRANTKYTEQNVQDPMNVRVMRSIYCLYAQLRSFIYSENIDPMQQHKITKILNHSHLIEGQEWSILQQQLNEKGVELTTADSAELSSKVNKYNKIKSQLTSAERSLKLVADKKSEDNLHDLMNKLNLYKTQKKGGMQNIKHPKETVLASTIKLNKDQKDEIVAKSLQLDETMKKVLADI